MHVKACVLCPCPSCSVKAAQPFDCFVNIQNPCLRPPSIQSRTRPEDRIFSRPVTKLPAQSVWPSPPFHCSLRPQSMERCVACVRAVASLRQAPHPPLASWYPQPVTSLHRQWRSAPRVPGRAPASEKRILPYRFPHITEAVKKVIPGCTAQHRRTASSATCLH